MRHVLATMVAATALAGSATAEGLPQQFDLLCDTHGNPARIEPPRHLHIDLKAGAWCENDCKISHGGASLIGRDIILEDRTHDYDTGYKLTEMQTLNADTLDYFGISEAEQGGQFIYRFAIAGSCRRAAFSGVTGPLTPW